jgi:hypothetical protein
VVALATIGQTMKRKGVVGGAVDSALDAIPFVGGAKMMCEVVRGRDFIPERQRIPVANTSVAQPIRGKANR